MRDLIDRKALIVEYDRVHIGPPGGARKLMEAAPTVDAVEVSDKRIEKVVKLIESEYERALKLEYIRNPLAYALYQVWKKIEGKEKR